MSEAYDRRLVDDGGAAYERFATGVVAGSFGVFVLALGALFGWVPVEGRVGGVPAATAFGGATVALGVATGWLGLRSRRGGTETTPDRSPGLAVGLVHAVLWAVTAGLVASNSLGLGGAGWLAAVPVGALAGYLTIASREDVGATVPTGLFACLVGALFLSGVITPAWAWNVAAFEATFPGTIVVPLLSMLGALLTAWASASAAEGFGTRGRQSGAFLLISLVVLLVLSVLAFLVVFVVERGLAVVVENATVGAVTALAVVGTALFVLVRSGRLRPTIADGTDRVVAFVRLALAVALALGCLRLVTAIATNSAISRATITVEPTTTLGAVPGLVAGAVLLAVARQSGRSWTPDSDVGRRLDVGLRFGVVLLGATVLVEGVTGTALAAGRVGLVPVLALVVGGVSLGSLALGSAARPSGAADRLAWTPPGWRAGGIALWAFVFVCLHVAVTGAPVGWGPVGVGGGTLEWPFVMNPSQGLGIQKGVMPAILGTVWIVVGAVTFAVPLAVGAAVYLTEYAEDSAFTRAVDVATNGLWSTPSIVFGLFGLAFLVPRFGGTPSIFAAQLVLGFMLLPLVLITSREAMKSVPDEYRDASAALGVSRWETIRSIVVPAAMPGVATGVILGVGRIAGETAPLLLVLNGPNFPNAAPGVLTSFTFELGTTPPFVHVSNPALLERASALPYQLYAVITAGVGAEESFGWGTTLVLLGVVVGFFAMGIATRRYFRQKLHQ
ncbi:phosphate transport system permease protein [Halomicrobium zhouii]|uniref:Phosphate transport system permease protein PstA n=1 Tax=Halomicrobium zhouii TaxID=767519 RepID=A0A1I6M2U5_9EURY|nr:phosphate ABC transporter permease PstA [Halomicrobium zhouii]SFS10035.1 phosphate transport system permease protein [Halomicrobium zhouii]